MRCFFTCRHNFESDLEENSLLIVQCDNGNKNARLLACAQFCVLDLQQQVAEKKTGKSHVVFIIHLPRVSGLCFAGFRVSLKLFSSCSVRKNSFHGHVFLWLWRVQWSPTSLWLAFDDNVGHYGRQPFMFFNFHPLDIHIIWYYVQ